MRVRLLSDIHLELATNGPKLMSKFVPLVPGDDILILAGDIGNPTKKLYQSFITEMSKHYAKVFVVAGNHEYYQGYKRTFDQRIQEVSGKFRLSMDDIDQTITDLTNSLPNVHFMQRNVVIYNRIRFLGCTLWIQADPILASGINDYNYIPNLTPEKCTELHVRDIKWLESQLNLPNDGTYDSTVVMTHHLPSYKLIADKYLGHPLNGFYADNLDYLVKQVGMWTYSLCKTCFDRKVSLLCESNWIFT